MSSNLLCAACIAGCLTTFSSLAAPVPPPAVVSTSAPRSATTPGQNTTTVKSTRLPKASFKPNWQDLTPEQQISLQPLGPNWNTISTAEKRKWIAMAANYPTLAPAEQAKLHSRMTEWSSLSQQQRTQARLNFAKSKQLSASQKTATWEAYQALSPEEKRKLAIAAPGKPKGAAVATKLASGQKLVKIPASRRSPSLAASQPPAAPSVDRNTLLPHWSQPQESPPAQKN